MFKALITTFCLLLSFAGYSQQGYIFEDSMLVHTTDGAELSLMIMRKASSPAPLPVLLQFTIYVRDKGRDLRSLQEIADRGYVGVIAYTRGKRLSKDEIWPYENEHRDAYEVIDWISKQAWCNGNIGMFGGSYNGFSQWAACKRLHPALKTIVPYVANRPGMGLPMENNIFINPNYEWSFYVGNNKYLDTLAGNDRKRFRNMMFRWWDTGVAYNKMDSIDGTPNRWFQRWITHPDFDRYWQDMAPYGDDFKHINIPVLAIDGYYNDSQNSSLYYLRQLGKRDNVYLVIGPYSHFGAQVGGDTILNGYRVDSCAIINTKALTFAWMDHVFKNAPLPPILKDKVNYEVMGANRWESAGGLSQNSQRYYLSVRPRALTPVKPSRLAFIQQKVDFADRKESRNDYYPDPIIRQDIDTTNGYAFTTAPFAKDIIYTGSFSGELSFSINKKDVDVGVTVYEIQPDGSYFHLSYTIVRASYAADPTHRQLLQPGKRVYIPLNNTHFVSKQLHKGSRLLVIINVNKNPFSQLNYGTGKEVSTETIKDAGVPLQINWYNTSYVDLPINVNL